MVLRELLDRVHASRSPRHLAGDPLSFCRRYRDPEDREVAAVIAAAFAYGGIKVIFRTLGAVFSELGPSPRRYVERFDSGTGLKTFAGFRHRFNDGRDLTALLMAVRSMLTVSGSVNGFFLRFHDASSGSIATALNGYSAAVQSMDYSAVFRQESPDPAPSFRFLFPSPAGGSACKRLCMFLRWTVRPDDGYDLGLWQGLSPSRLIIPVDTHVGRISTYIGLTGRRTADWRMAEEITAALRVLDPADPVKYDFALAHLGISGRCTGKDPGACCDCCLREICRQYAALPAEPAV